jgi:hypothetical protein
LRALDLRVALGEGATQAGQIAVPVDQRGRGLLTDSGDAGNPSLMSPRSVAMSA